MSNEFTALAPVAYSAAVQVAKESAGALDAVRQDFDDKGVARDNSVKIPVAGAATTSAFTPSNVNPNATDSTPTALSVTLDNFQKSNFDLTAEERKALSNGGTLGDWTQQKIAQAMRALRNEAEVALCDVIYQGASRAIGVAGTTPFASDIDLLAVAKKELRDNGAPMVDAQCVIDTSAALNIQKLNIYQAANAAGSDEERRTGLFKKQFGFTIRDSAGIELHTNGTGSSYVSDGIEAIGQTTLTVKTGSGTVVVGDVVTQALDTDNKYVCTGAIAAAGDMEIGKPGLKIATADGTAWTIGDDYIPNMCFERDAVIAIMRVPEFDSDGKIYETMPITGPDGLTYLLVKNMQYGQTLWEIHIAYAFAVVNSEFVINVMG